MEAEIAKTTEEIPVIDRTQRENIKVLKDINELEIAVSKAKSLKVNQILCTEAVLKEILMDKWNETPYMMYKGIKLADYLKIEKANLRDSENYNKKVFG